MREATAVKARVRGVVVRAATAVARATAVAMARVTAGLGRQLHDTQG